MSTNAFAVGVAVSACAAAYFYKATKTANPPLPPSPPADFIIGHARVFPSSHQEEWFSELAKEYGEVIHLWIPGRDIIVLNTVEAAIDLLEKRGAIYTDRPRLVTLEIMGWSRTLSILNAGKIFQTQRRILQDYLHARTIEKYQNFQQAEARRLVKKLVQNGDDRQSGFERFAASSILDIAYGHQIESDEDDFLKITAQVNYAVSNCGSPGGNLVDFFPFVKYLPKWFPGAYYSGLAQEYRKHVDALHDLPYAKVKREKALGTAKPSLVLHYLEKVESGEDAEGKYPLIDVKHAAAVAFAAGGETTSSTLSYICLAMILYPECQRRAQQEIDEVVGTDRLPNFSDRKDLPYVEALYQELLRWHPVTPIGMPHRSREDDMYRGWFIPKGSVVIPNVKAMTRDERTYKDPETFNPSRYLPKPEGSGEPYPSIIWGFGRRVCPGKHLADSNVWIAIATMLATLHISKALDAEGKEITPKVEVTSGVTSHPVPFPCEIEARSEAALALINESPDY